jgi:hypothetical protein
VSDLAIMNYYQYCFGGLAVLCGGLFVSQPTRRQEVHMKRQNNELQQVSRDDDHPEEHWYKAYSLVMAADWLQVSIPPMNLLCCE